MCYNNNVIKERKEVIRMDYLHKMLTKYGKIIEDKEYKTTEGNYIRFTTFEYAETRHIVVMCDGAIISIAEQ